MAKQRRKRRPRPPHLCDSKDVHGYARQAESLNRLGFHSYQQYLKSDLWKGIRQRAIRLSGGFCQVCKTNAPTEVHHRHYSMDVMSGANISSLVPICRTCHSLAEFNQGKKTSLGEANKRVADAAKQQKQIDIVRVTYVTVPDEPRRRPRNHTKNRRK